MAVEKSKVPYVISEAHPDYKRPYLYQSFGSINPSDSTKFFLDKISNFIIEHHDIDSINSIEDITKFYASFYIDSYMDNYIWSAMMFIDDKWINCTPSNKSIFENIQKIKLEENTME